MILNSEIFDYTPEICGGGYKVTSSYVGRKEDNVVLQCMKGGVKLDNALTRDRL